MAITRKEKSKGLALLKKLQKTFLQLEENEQEYKKIRAKMDHYMIGYGAINLSIGWCISSIVLFVVLSGVAGYFYGIQKRIPTQEEALVAQIVLALSCLAMLYFIAERITYKLRAKIRLIIGMNRGGKWGDRKFKNIEQSTKLQEQLKALYSELHIPEIHQYKSDVDRLVFFFKRATPSRSGTAAEWIEHSYEVWDGPRYTDNEPSHPDIPLNYAGDIKEASPWTDFRTGETLYRTYGGKIVNASGEEVSVAWWE